MAKNTEQSGDMSMQDVAAMIVAPIEKDAKKADPKKPIKSVEEPSEELSEETSEETLDDATEEDEAVEASDDLDDEDIDESPSGGEDEDGGDQDEVEYLDVGDDVLVDVMVDGEEHEVSIADLKRAYSGEGAIEKRLQEATELRKTAHAERTSALERLYTNEQVLLQALDGLDDSLFKEVIPAPTERLRQENPEQYLRHKDAYDQDQKRISEARKYFENKKAELEKQRAERLQEYGAQAAQVIAAEIPELVKPETGQAYYKGMVETAKMYGYSDAEISNALDPRMFLLVRDAMKYRKLMDKTKERDPKDLNGQKAKKIRRLKSGNTSAKTRARQADNQRQKIREKARKSGKVSDIAATLIS